MVHNIAQYAKKLEKNAPGKRGMGQWKIRVKLERMCIPDQADMHIRII